MKSDSQPIETFINTDTIVNSSCKEEREMGTPHKKTLDVTRNHAVISLFQKILSLFNQGGV